MDKIYINSEQLDFEGNYSLSLMANNYLEWQPGTAFKSERLTFYNTVKNRRLLGNIFHTGADTSNVFEATYKSDIVEMTGYIKILQANHAKAEAVFYSGNGVLWEELKGIKLNEIDCSEYDHVLNVANVEASETYSASNFYLYDLCNRGTRITAGEVDILERYPAVNLRLLLGKIFDGYSLTGDLINETWFKRLFLLFTQSNEIRNSADWKKDALISVGKTSDQVIDISFTETPAAFLLNATLITFVDSAPFFDNGSNFASNTFTVPETGTYRLFYNIKVTLLFGFSIGGSIDGTAIIFIYKNDSAYLYKEIELKTVTVNIDESFDTGFTEFIEGDTFKAYIYCTGSYTSTLVTATARVEDTTVFFNELSRWYGYGSTVEMSAILPDITALDFINDIFNYFCLFPFYDVEGRVINLTQLKTDPESFDISDRINPKDGVTFEIPENTNFKLSFADDSNDKYYKFAVDNGIVEDGSYELNNGAKETKEIRLNKLSDTFMDYFDNPSSVTFKVPKLWNDLTGLKWSTKFNLRILYFEGLEDFSYKLNHGIDTGVVQTTMDAAPILTNYSETDSINLTFETIGTVEGLAKYHRRIFDSMAAGKLATCIVKLTASEIANFYACVSGKDLRTPVYISLPYISARFLILKMVQKQGNFFEFYLMQKFD